MESNLRRSLHRQGQVACWLARPARCPHRRPFAFVAHSKLVEALANQARRCDGRRQLGTGSPSAPDEAPRALAAHDRSSVSNAVTYDDCRHQRSNSSGRKGRHGALGGLPRPMARDDTCDFRRFGSMDPANEGASTGKSLKRRLREAVSKVRLRRPRSSAC